MSALAWIAVYWLAAFVVLFAVGWVLCRRAHRARARDRHPSRRERRRRGLDDLLADPAAYMRRQMDRMSNRDARRRFAAIAAREWPDGIRPAPPQPSPASPWDAHCDRLHEVIPDNTQPNPREDRP